MYLVFYGVLNKWNEIKWNNLFQNEMKFIDKTWFRNDWSINKENFDLNAVAHQIAIGLKIDCFYMYMCM